MEEQGRWGSFWRRGGGWGGESVYCLFWHLKATCTLWLMVLFLHLSHQQWRVESFSRPLFWLPLASLGLLSYSAFPLSEPVTTLGSLRRTTHLRNLNWSVPAQPLCLGRWSLHMFQFKHRYLQGHSSTYSNGKPDTVPDVMRFTDDPISSWERLETGDEMVYRSHGKVKVLSLINHFKIWGNWTFYKTLKFPL